MFAGLPQHFVLRNDEAKGFTLIELMMVTTIVLILSGGSIAAYLNFNKTESIKNDARNLISEIYRVRTLASTLQYPTGCDSLKGYKIKSDVLLSGVMVTADCDPTDVIFPTVKLLLGSVFTQAFEMTFLPGSGYLTNGSDQQIVIKNSNEATVTKTITVGAYGNITSN